MPDEDPLLPRHDDVDLHHELSPKERVDAILNSPHLTTPEAVVALDAQFRENQGTFPHVVITSVMVSATPGGKSDVEHRAYYGPFADRRAAEAWAEQRFASIDRVTWKVDRMLTAEMDAHETEQLRRILEGD